MGAIMLNAAMDKCLLVKSWGSNGAWGFPRGKISTGEADIDCARREVRACALAVPPLAQRHLKAVEIQLNCPIYCCPSHENGALTCSKLH